MAPPSGWRKLRPSVSSELERDRLWPRGGGSCSRAPPLRPPVTRRRVGGAGKTRAAQVALWAGRLCLCSVLLLLPLSLLLPLLLLVFVCLCGPLRWLCAPLPVLSRRTAPMQHCSTGAARPARCSPAKLHWPLQRQGQLLAHWRRLGSFGRANRPAGCLSAGALCLPAASHQSQRARPLHSARLAPRIGPPNWPPAADRLSLSSLGEERSLSKLATRAHTSRDSFRLGSSCLGAT